jgi:5-(carboxyamino)imidazole ribonucleotide synthase
VTRAAGPLPPGATVGILGSGQLGRMLAVAARQHGYGVAVYSPDADSPAEAVADRAVVAPYSDLDAIAAFARGVDVVTFEFENVPAAAAAAAAAWAPVRPAGEVLHVTQHRLREKRFLADAGLPVAPFRAVDSAADLAAALAELGAPAVLKTAGFGYDGKGQFKLADPGPATQAAAMAMLGGQPGVLEAWIPFERELSVIAARSVTGEFRAWPAFENRHRHHVLDLTLCPADLPPGVAARAEALARAVLERLDVVGVLCVELFLRTDAGTELIVNELAPRPHNSGHLTLEASVTSQFEQQLRAVCGLPLGETDTCPAAMVNLMGDLWANGEPNWSAALGLPGVHLHLYGKRAARAGRKMGHLTVLGPTPALAAERALAARAALTPA